MRRSLGFWCAWVGLCAGVVASAQSRTEVFTASGAVITDVVYRPLDDGGTSVTACGALITADGGTALPGCEPFEGRTVAQRNAFETSFEYGRRVFLRGVRVGDAGL